MILSNMNLYLQVFGKALEPHSLESPSRDVPSTGPKLCGGRSKMWDFGPPTMRTPQYTNSLDVFWHCPFSLPSTSKWHMMPYVLVRWMKQMTPDCMTCLHMFPKHGCTPKFGKFPAGVFSSEALEPTMMWKDGTIV